jgi:hypothetical protein
MITEHEYFGIYKGHPNATPEVCANARDLLQRVNAVYAAAAADGCELPDNPSTGSGVSGRRHGGFRPRDSEVGADNSLHKDGKAVDRYDPKRQFASWCMAHLRVLEAHGLYMEDTRWTPTWVHLQCQPPRSGRRVYIPSSAAPLVGLPPVWPV